MSIVEWRLSNGDCRMAIAEWRLPNGDCRMSIAECRLPNVDCRMSIAECRLQIDFGSWDEVDVGALHRHTVILSLIGDPQVWEEAYRAFIHHHQKKMHQAVGWLRR